MRILFVTARPPWPARRGDQVRSSTLVEELSQRHEVEVVSQVWAAPGRRSRHPLGVAPEGVRYEPVAIPAARLALSLAAASSRPLQVALHRHTVFRQAVKRRVEAFAPDILVVVLSRLGDVLEAVPEVPAVVDFIDSLGLNMRRRADRQAWAAALWRTEARRMADWDRRLLGRCRRATVVAERDREALLGGSETFGEKIAVVPLGLRLETVSPLAVPRHPVVALTGNLGYFPTVEGALWFAREVWPTIRRRVPGAEWWLAGARPARAIRRLAVLPGVKVEADPEDLNSITRQAAVSVAPLRAGSGTPVKVLEAMAAMVPVVTTRDGCEGLDGLPEGAVRAADEPLTFAAAVCDLLGDSGKAHRQSLLARRWLERRHDLGAVATTFEAVLEEAVSSRSDSPSP